MGGGEVFSTRIVFQKIEVQYFQDGWNVGFHDFHQSYWCITKAMKESGSGAQGGRILPAEFCLGNVAEVMKLSQSQRRSWDGW